MIACAVIVSDVHEPLTLWSVEENHTITYSNILLLLPFISRDSHTAV